MLTVIALSPFALLAFLPFACRLAPVPAVSERILSQAGSLGAAGGGLLLAATAWSAGQPLQAALSSLAGVGVMMFARSADTQARLSGRVARVALALIGVSLAGALTFGAALAATVIVTAALLLPVTLERLGSMSAPASVPESLSCAPVDFGDPLAFSAEYANDRELNESARFLLATTAGIDECRNDQAAAAEIPSAEQTPPFRRRRRADLLDPPPRQLGAGPPPRPQITPLGDGQFDRRSRDL